MPNPLATPTPTRTVFAGPLSAQYEKGELRYVRFGGREVLRRIYVAVRDRNWETIPIQVKESVFESTESTFYVELEARHELDGIVFEWRGSLRGDAGGSIRVEMNGEPKTSFLRNRIGLCVLHPMETCSGRPCEIEHTDGRRESSQFPELVSPHQPFLDLRALSYEVAPGVQAEVRFTGDEFETEDQRNWSDYTFKTYSTRLGLPIPVPVKPGDRVEQSVELKLTGTAAPHRHSVRPAEPPVEIALHDETAPFPKVGTVFADGLSAVGAHTRVDVDFADPDWPIRLQAAAAWQLPLEIACLSDRPQNDLPLLKEELTKLNPAVVRFLLFPASRPFTDPAAVAEAKRIFARDAGHEVSIAAGSRGAFADLNRNRTIVANADEVVWPVDPYVHADDYRTVIENLQGQMDPPRTARVFSGGRPLVISAVVVPDIAARAGWVAVSLKQLAQQGVSSITYDLSGVALPELTRFLGTEIVRSTSSDPLRVDALTVKTKEKTTAFVANFSGEPVGEIRIGGQALKLAPFEMKTAIL